MVTLYTVLKTLHVIAIASWVGGAAMLQVLVSRAKRSGDPERLATITQDAEVLGTRIFVPSSLLVVITGFGMIAKGDLPYQTWIVIGLVVWALSFLTGLLFLGPESGRVSKLVAERGVAQEDVAARVSRLFLVSRIENLLIALMIIDMVIKPGST